MVLKKVIGEYDDEKCHLICLSNFYELLENLPAVVCIYIYISSMVMHQHAVWRGLGGKTGFFWNS